MTFRLEPQQCTIENHEGWQAWRPSEAEGAYGEGTVYKREGEGDDAKITVKFRGFGEKKLVEKFAQLEPA